MSIILSPYFWNEPAAHAKLEEIVWPNGPVCMRCGATDRIGAVTGKGARAGLKFCCRCRKQFRATIGTMFEGSHVPLHKWFQACFLLSMAGAAVSAHQLHLRLDVTNKTALGIVQRLAAVIKNAGCPQRSWHRQMAGGQGAVGWNELPWMNFPTQPRRQFLRFAQSVGELGCVEDEAGFERLLATIGTHGTGRTSEKQSPVFAVSRARAFAPPARTEREHAAA